MSLAAILACHPIVISAEDFTQKSALDLLPASTMAYLEVPQPPVLIRSLFEHPLIKQLEQQPDFRRALDTAEMQHLRSAVKVFEDSLGVQWRPALQSITAEGVYVGFEISTQGVALLVRADDTQLLEKARDTFIEFARANAAELGKEDPVKPDDYRGVTVYKVDEVSYATVGPWLILTNKARLARMILDNAVGTTGQSLGSEEQFVNARKRRPKDSTAWAYVDLTILRITGITKAALDKRSDNPGTELILGGIFDAALRANFVTASLDVGTQQITLSAEMPFEADRIDNKREFFFGPKATGAAPPILEPRDTIVSLSAYRDFGLMWKRAPDLFDDNVNAKFAEAESGLTTLFSGKSFPDDILANLQPGVQMVVTRQRFAEGEVTPQLKLPAVAFVFTMKNPEETSRDFKITYQSLVGFLNIAGAQGGLKEPLEQNVEKLDDITVASATYLPPKEGDRQAAGIHFNASPTVAFIGDKFILSSSKSLAVELARLFETKTAAGDRGVNSQLLVRGDALRASLEDNRAHLIAHNQTEKGHSRAESEKEIDLLMQFLEVFEEVSLNMTTDGETLRVSWNLQLQEKS